MLPDKVIEDMQRQVRVHRITMRDVLHSQIGNTDC